MPERDARAEEPGSAPLAADATIDDIVARVAHLSAAAGVPSPAAGPEPALAEEPDASVPWPGAQDGVAVPDARFPAGARKPSRSRVAVGLGATLVAVAIVAAKFGLKMFAVGALGVALSGAFGSRYDALPENQRADFERRFEAAVGPSFRDLSDAEQQRRFEDLVERGARRLDDAALTAWTRLDAKADAATDEKTCATIARGWFSRDADKKAARDAVAKAYESLSVEDFARIVDLNLLAVEAETRAQSDFRAVTDDEAGPVLDLVDAHMSAADTATLGAMWEGTPTTDAAACTALRNVEAAAAKLDEHDFATWAVWLVTP